MRKLGKFFIGGAIVITTSAVAVFSLKNSEKGNLIAKYNHNVKNYIAENSDSSSIVTINFPDANMARAVYQRVKSENVIDYTTNSIKMEQEKIDSIESLDLSQRSISNIEGIQYFKNLKTLNLGSNSISSITQIGELTQLTNLNLSKNRNIVNIEALGNNVLLTKLDISGNAITDLSGLSSLTVLTELDASDNNISILTPIRNLRRLTILNLYKNNINSIQEIVGLVNLRNLNLSSNQLASNKNGGLVNITSLVKLERLDISSNAGLTDMEPLVKASRVLGLINSETEKLDIYAVYDEDRGEFVGTSSEYNPEDGSIEYQDVEEPILRNLESLNISNNRINSGDFYPVMRLKYLKELISTNNQIEDISGISDLVFLEKLNLGDNRLTDITPLFEKAENDEGNRYLKLGRLTDVSLANNYNKTEDSYGIEYIYKDDSYWADDREYMERISFASFERLKRLDLSGNRIFNIDTIANKEFEQYGLNLTNQTIFESLNKREEDDEFQAVMLPNIFSYTMQNSSNVYTGEDYKYRVAYRRDSNKAIEHEETTNYNVCGISNEDGNITDKHLVFVDTYALRQNSEDWEKGTNVATVEIVGGNADGTKIIFNSVDNGGLESIIFKDHNLFLKTVQEIRTKREGDYGHDALDYGSMGIYNLVNIYDFNLDQIRILEADKSNIEYVDGIKRIKQLEYLKLGENKIKEVGELSLLENLSNLSINKNGISNINEYKVTKRSTSDARGKRRTITEIKRELKSAPRLYYLDASENRNEELQSIGISNIDILKTCVSLQQLYLQNNNISDVSPLENLEYLNILNLGVNNISDISKLTKLTSLEQLILASNRLEDSDLRDLVPLIRLSYLDLSANKLKDISTLNQVTTLTNLYLSKNNIDTTTGISGLRRLNILDMSVNKIANLSGLNSLTSLTKLYLSNNKISDVTPLARLTKLTELDLKFNKISQVGTIEYLKQVGVNDIHLENQRIVVEIDGNETEYQIELPELFKKAKMSDNMFYSEEGLQLTKCTLNGDMVAVSNLFNDIAIVEIAEPSIAQNSTLVIGESLRGNIEYSTTAPTRGEVIATLTDFNRPSNVKVKVTNNEGNNTYTFKENGTFTFEFEDEYGFEGTKTAEVTWLDNEKPTLQIAYEPQEIEEDGTTIYTTIVTITSNEKVQPVSGWELSTDQLTLTKTYSETKTETIKVLDLVGNESEIIANVTVKTEEPEEPDPPQPPKEDLKVESTEYEISDIENPDYISKVTGNTKVGDFLNNITTNANDVVVKNASGTVVENDDLVTTGMTVTFDETVVYTIVVTGDINGDGLVRGSDLSIMKRALVSKRTLEGAYLKAADINLDGSLKGSDLSRLKRMLVGK